MVFKVTATKDLPMDSKLRMGRLSWNYRVRGTDSITVRVPSEGSVDKVRAVVRDSSSNIKCHDLLAPGDSPAEAVYVACRLTTIRSLVEMMKEQD